MIRRAPILLGLLLLGGCVYDPYTGTYYPCCTYPAPYGYAPYYPYPYPPPQYGYPPPAGYPAAQPAPSAELPDAGALVRRFDAANVTHDGRLTLQQAQAAQWTEIAGNFPAIDIGQKGYVTLDDIRVWLAAHDAAPPGRG
jgi:hypothetical protein